MTTPLDGIFATPGVAEHGPEAAATPLRPRGMTVTEVTTEFIDIA